MSETSLIWALLGELDPGLQARRARRLLTGTTVDAELRRAVEGRIVLITGASSGIGRYVARACARSGAEVLLVARRKELLLELADEIAAEGGRAHVHVCDLSDEVEVTALAAEVLEEYGGVDVLVNNAGRSIRRSMRNTADRMHDYDRVMRLNYFGMVWLTVPIVDHMRRRGGCHVVNISTLGTQIQAQPRFAAYIASKCAMDGFTRAVAPETRVDGVTWTIVNLPLVRTEMIAPTRIYRSAPAMSLAQGGDMVLDAIRRRPTRVSHPAGTAATLFNLVAPKTLDLLRSQGFRPTAAAVSEQEQEQVDG